MADKPAYCNIPPASDVIAGKSLVLEIWDETGNDFLALAGQQNLTINRSKETIEVGSKTTKSGWSDALDGMKSWSVDSDGLYVHGDSSHKTLSKCFDNDTPVCLKVVNVKTNEDWYGGLGSVTDYPIEAPYDDSVTFSTTITGRGPLVDLQDDSEPSDG